jgi:hypothetical protein
MYQYHVVAKTPPYLPTSLGVNLVCYLPTPLISSGVLRTNKNYGLFIPSWTQVEKWDQTNAGN